MRTSQELFRSNMTRGLQWLRQQLSSEIQVDFRDRISVATWLIVLGLATSLLLDLPTTVLSFRALGSPVSIPISGTTLAAGFLAVLAAAATEGIITVHPSWADRREWGRSWVFWALPMALTIIATLLLPSAPSALIQVIGLLVSGGLLALSFICLYVTVEPGQLGFRRARLLLDAMAYGSALLLFLFVYQTRTRSLLSGSLIAATAMLLAIEILRNSSDQRVGVVISYGAIVGLILGQMTWALNYWPRLPDLTGGLLLLLIFYLLSGLAQQGLQDRLNRRVLLEFAVFALVAVILIGAVGPGF